MQRPLTGRGGAVVLLGDPLVQVEVRLHRRLLDQVLEQHVSPVLLQHDLPEARRGHARDLLARGREAVTHIHGHDAPVGLSHLCLRQAFTEVTQVQSTARTARVTQVCRGSGCGSPTSSARTRVRPASCHARTSPASRCSIPGPLLRRRRTRRRANPLRGLL